MSYLCPVCGYNEMVRPPEDFYICPSCGTEFENDDFETTHFELRERWKANGMKWFSNYTPPPLYWNPEIQLQNVVHSTGKPRRLTADTVKEVNSFVAYWELEFDD